MDLSTERSAEFDRVNEKIGNTALERYDGSVPNGNSIWIKRECDNEWGSHYDRVYSELFREWEVERGLKPGTNVLETTSGSAGFSFAGIGRELGYNCYVMIPDDSIKRRRIEAIRGQGGIILPTPSGEDIQGFTPERIRENKRRYGAKFLNHSSGPGGVNNEATLRSLEPIAREVLDRARVDVFVAGIGNGSSVVGPGRVFKAVNSGTSIVGFMPRTPGKTGFPGLMNQTGLERQISFPHITEAQKLMDRIELFGEEDLVRGDYSWAGKSTQAGLGVALREAERVHGKNILVIAYDLAERY